MSRLNFLAMSEVLASKADGGTRKQITTRGWVILSVSGVTLGLLYVVTTPFLLPAFRKICLPFVPATSEQIRNVMIALEGRVGPLIDIGSGDGRIVLEAARHGFQSYGVELNSSLVLYSRWSAWQKKLGSKTTFFKKDLWKTDLSLYKNIVIFGVEPMMADLEDKLTRELSEDGCVVACRFPLPNWIPTRRVGNGLDTVWLYQLNIHAKHENR